jgi:glyoxylase-like metal-dependent hydrolase (beta-lactamase superfamily II)
MKTLISKSGYKIIQILFQRSNVFLLTDGHTNILIDSGPKTERRFLVKRLIKLNVKRIDYLIQTHTHFDHAENSAFIREKYNAKVIVHKNEADCLAAGENILPQGTNPITRLIVRLFSKSFLSRARYEPCCSDIQVDAVYYLTSTGLNSYILHTPGHTPGSMSIIVDDEIAIVGDTMFGVFKGSVFPPYSNDIKQMILSWGLLLETGCSWFLPGHGTANSRLLVQNNYIRRVKNR